MQQYACNSTHASALLASSHPAQFSADGTPYRMLCPVAMAARSYCTFDARFGAPCSALLCQSLRTDVRSCRPGSGTRPLNLNRRLTAADPEEEDLGGAAAEPAHRWQRSCRLRGGAHAHERRPRDCRLADWSEHRLIDPSPGACLPVCPTDEAVLRGMCSKTRL